MEECREDVESGRLQCSRRLERAKGCEDGLEERETRGRRLGADDTESASEGLGIV